MVGGNKCLPVNAPTKVVRVVWRMESKHSPLDTCDKMR